MNAIEKAIEMLDNILRARLGSKDQTQTAVDATLELDRLSRLAALVQNSDGSDGPLMKIVEATANLNTWTQIPRSGFKNGGELREAAKQTLTAARAAMKEAE